LTGASGRPDPPAVPVALAATVVLIRPGPAGPEVLLTRRPSTMAFAPDLHVFPGGRVDIADADPLQHERSSRSAAAAAAALGGNVSPVDALALHLAAIRELHEEAGILLVDRVMEDVRLATDRLAPIAHWTTPAFMPRRFSTWFFVADLPPGVDPVFAADEVDDHAWLSPLDALDRVAAGAIQMWVPTTSVLQRLIETGAAAADEVAARLTLGRVARPEIVTDEPAEVRFRFSGAGGLPGRRCDTRLIGRRDVILVDPGDASEEAIDAILAAVARRDAAIRAIVLTRTDPDHAAGAEALAIPLGVPILVAPGAGRHLPYRTAEVADGDLLPADVDVHARLDGPGSGRLSLGLPADG